MRSGRWSSKALWVAALVPLFAAAVLPTQVTTLVCRFSGVVMDVETCCPPRPDERAETHAQLLDESCCVLKTVDLQRLVSERRFDGPQPRAHHLVSGMPLVGTLALADRPQLVQQIGPPPLGPPIILLKRSFLI